MTQKSNSHQILNCIYTRKHPGRVEYVSFDSSNKIVFSWSRLIDKATKINVTSWNLKTGELLRIFKGDFESANSVDICPQEWLLASRRNNKISVWNLETEQKISTFSCHPSDTSLIAISKDGRTIFTSKGSEIVEAWEQTSGNFLYSFPGSVGRTASIVNNSLRPLFVSFSKERKNIRIGNLLTGKELFILKGHSSIVSGISISKNGDILASSSWDSTIKLWDLQTGKELTTLKNSDPIDSINITSDTQLVISGNLDGTIKLWNLETFQPIYKIKEHKHRIRSITINSNQEKIMFVSGSWDNSIKFWEFNQIFY